MYQPPANYYLSGILILVAVQFGVLGIRRFVTAFRHYGEYTCASWLIKGIRCSLIALTALTWSASLFFQQQWLFIIGLVIIGQELFEGFLLSSAVKDGAELETTQAESK